MPKLRQDAVPLDDDDDFYDMEVRNVELGPRGQNLSHSVSPKKSDRAWLASRKAWEVEDREDIGLDPTSAEYDAALENDVDTSTEHDIPEKKALETDSTKKTQASKRTLRRKRPHKYWKLFCQQEFLDELLRDDGRGDAMGQAACWDCRGNMAEEPREALYWCQQCFGGHLLCAECCLARHRHLPFHRILRWTDCIFEPVSLKDMGLKIQLNHFGLTCSRPAQCNVRLRILHWGVHDVNLSFCNCVHAIPQHLQLLRRGLYPSTTGTGRITTVATFEFLEFCHHLTLTTKASTYDIYRALARSTDNTGLDSVPWRYRALMRMILQWRHLKLLKRCGRGHDNSGVAGTREGELVVPCPSCPYPGINLPSGWRLDTKRRFLYALRLAMDANFRLKEQLVSNHVGDPGLCDGEGYFVKRVPYEDYVLGRADEADISQCVGFAAMAKALTKFSNGQRYTGVGALGCARAEMFLPNCAGNLQKGERYANMDYVYASVLTHFPLLFLVFIGYDIACQWFANITTREKHWPDKLKPPKSLAAIPVIGKFHLPGHEERDHEKFNCNLVLGNGLADFEVMERLWGLHNLLGNSTKTMGPGTRIDTLESHFGFHNWEKYKTMGVTLWSRYKAAVIERNKQREAHRSFTDCLPKELVQGWVALCEIWEVAAFPKKNLVNPFEVKNEFLSTKEVEKELAEEEQERARNNKPARHTTSAAKFVLLGLELEDSQRKHELELKKYAASSKTSKQTTSILDGRRILNRNIRSYEELRGAYMPGLLQLLKELKEPTWHDEDDVEARPEAVKLWLPSDVPSERRAGICEEGIAGIEERLRFSRCHDALAKLRHGLRVKTRMLMFKNANVRGQRQSGRSREVIDRVHENIKESANMYRCNRAALKRLIGKGDWERVLRELEIHDVRSYAEPGRKSKGKGRRGIREEDEEEGNEEAAEEKDDEEMRDLESLRAEDLFEAERGRRDGTGETRKEISWIWRVSAINLEDGADENDNEILRNEWCRSRARAARSEEEVLQLREEMRRTGAFLTWKAGWWDQKRTSRSVEDPHLREGLVAYAYKQARIQRGLADKFVMLWRKPLDAPEEKESEEERLARVGLGLDGEETKEEDEVDEEEEDVDGEQGNDRGDVTKPDREAEPGEDAADEADAIRA